MICNIIKRYPFGTSSDFNIISYYFDLVKTSATQTFVKLFVKNITSEKEISL